MNAKKLSRMARLWFSLVALSAQNLWADSSELTFGWFSRIDQIAALPSLRNQGLLTVMPYRGGATRDDVLAYLSYATNLGIKVVLKVAKSDIEDRDFLSRVIASGSISGFLIADEPELHGVPPVALKPLYDALKALAPKIPVAVVFSTARGYPETIPRYRDCFDVFWVDQYPIVKGAREGDRLRDGRFKRLIEMLDRISEVVQKPYVFVMQAFGTDLDGQSRNNRRDPTELEMRYMLSVVLAGRRSEGVLFWSLEAGTDRWRQHVLSPVVTDLLPLKRLITRESDWERQPDGLQVAVRASTEHKWALGINHGNKPMSVNLKTGIVLVPSLGTFWIEMTDLEGSLSANSGGRFNDQR